jgi:hypothetical protein
MFASRGLPTEILFDIVRLDSQLLSDVEQERQWYSISPFRWPAGETKQAELHSESEAVGIAAAAVHTEQVLIGQRPVTGDFAFVQIDLRETTKIRGVGT